MPDHRQPHPLRIALAGAGKMGGHHAKAIAAANPRAHLVAIADPVPGSLAASEEGIGPRRYLGLDELLSHETIDVVHIVTPPATHVELALKALEHGAHIYIEKPVADTPAGARLILEKAERRQLMVCAGHQLLCEAPSRQLFRILPALGTLIHVESYFAFRTVRRAPGGRAPLRADLQLLDVLPHPVYMLLETLHQASDAAPTLEGIHVDPKGTVHAIIRKGSVTGTLIVTLDGRPVDSYLRVVGTNGSATADYVRGTVQRHIGPGTSGIDKVVIPYRQAYQLAFGTTRALTSRLLQRKRSYPGLRELISAFYNAIEHATPSPVSPDNILQTTWLCDQVGTLLLSRFTASPAQRPHLRYPGVLVTGGTGFLGREVVKALRRRGRDVRVVARREPSPWEVIDGVDYMVGDLAEPLDGAVAAGIDTIIHCAAETAGGWEDHEKNSVLATEHVMRLAARTQIPRVIHVSSVAVLENRGRVDDQTPLNHNPKKAGPYVWGKLVSEQRAIALGHELGVEVKVVRPGPIVDYQNYEAPGRLGKRLANIFVAVGSPRKRLAVVDVTFAADILAWVSDNWEQLPATLNLLDPKAPTRGELVKRLRATNPDLGVVWLPTAILYPLSWAAILIQRVIRPRMVAMDIASAFAQREYSIDGCARLESLIKREGDRD